jgi:hypothetical protein
MYRDNILLSKIIFTAQAIVPPMSKVLKITKPDKTVHTAPLNNKAFYLSYNRRL